MRRIAVLLVLATLCRAAEKEPLSVLWITVDDMSAASVGAFGCRVENITPNIDRLAAQGLRFEHGHVTIAICQPTRAVWMTGRYPHRNGALGFDPIRPDVPTLVEALKKAGYRTGIVGKIRHVVPTRRKAWDLVATGSRDPSHYATQCSAFLAQAKKAKRPFFLMANTQDPHRPFAGSGQENAQRRKGKQFPGVRRTYEPAEVTVPGFLPDLPRVRREIAEYFTSVHRADETVGAVLKALDAAGLAEETLVLFLSDHGMPLPFGKTNCYRESTRTPWIVRWPGVVKPGGRDGKHLVAGIDLAPTVLDALGLPPLEGADGRSFVPLLRGKAQAGRDTVFTMINRTSAKREYPMRSLQTARFGYVFNAWADGKTRFRNESQAGRTMRAMRKAAETDEAVAARVRHFLYRTTEELYDYDKDPHGLQNRIDDPAYADEVERLRKLLRDRMRATGDPVLEAFLEKVPVSKPGSR